MKNEYKLNLEDIVKQIINNIVLLDESSPQNFVGEISEFTWKQMSGLNDNLYQDFQEVYGVLVVFPKPTEQQLKIAKKI